MVHIAPFAALAFALVTASLADTLPDTYTIIYPGRSSLADKTGQFSNSELSHTGAKSQEQGYFKLKADGTYVLVKKGSYNYISPEGVPVQITYFADDTGFHATGNAIPVAPAPVQPVF